MLLITCLSFGSSSTANDSPDVGPEYTYKCEFSGSESGLPAMRALYLQWHPDPYGSMVRVGEKEQLILDSDEHFRFKPGASVVIENRFGVDQEPFFTFSGTHGGGEFLRGFFVQPRNLIDVTTLWINTATGEAVLT